MNGDTPEIGLQPTYWVPTHSFRGTALLFLLACFWGKILLPRGSHQSHETACQMLPPLPNDAPASAPLTPQWSSLALSSLHNPLPLCQGIGGGEEAVSQVGGLRWVPHQTLPEATGSVSLINELA